MDNISVVARLARLFTIVWEVLRLPVAHLHFDTRRARCLETVFLH